MSRYLLLVCSIVVVVLGQTQQANTNASSSIDKEKPNGILLPGTPTDPDKLSVQLPTLITRFSCRLFSHIRDGQKNAVLSPLSLHMALSMLLMGSKVDSKTREEIATVLGYPILRGKCAYKPYHVAYSGIKRGLAKLAKEARDKRKQDPSSVPPILDLNQALLFSQDDKPQIAFINKIKKYYNATVDQLNKGHEAENLKGFNDWGRAYGFKSDLLSKNDLVDLKSMLLAIVQYEAQWYFKMDVNLNEAKFYNHASNKSLVMGTQLEGYFKRWDYNYIVFDHSEDSRKYEQFREKIGLEFHAINMKLYEGASMTIILPLNNEPGALDKLTKALLGSESNLETLLGLLDEPSTHMESLQIKMPAFNFENKINLKGFLTKMGIKNAFSSSNAEFSDMKNATDTSISHLDQMASVEVNECGIKSAGLLRSIILSDNLDVKYLKLRIEYPFMFIIRFRKLLIYVGQLVELPKQ